MTKSDRIIELLETTDLSNREIAERVGVLPAYVRVVQQRLLGGGPSRADKNYVGVDRERARKRYATDPNFRKRVDEANKRWRLKNPEATKAINRRANAAYRARRRAEGMAAQ